MPQLDVTELERADYDRYDSLVKSSPHGTVWALTSLAGYCGHRYTVLGVFKGRELVGGGLVPLAAGSLARHVDEVPWHGIVGRSGHEGENQGIARSLADYCLGRWPEATLSLSPEWTDIREFTWAGYRTHVRYTYRGWGAPFEKRVRVRPVKVRRGTATQDGWTEATYCYGGDSITCVFDWSHGYYWRANDGGQYHTELISRFIQDCRHAGLSFDLVGANSPDRALFKRGFGGTLTPYYTVTSCDAKDLRRPLPIHEYASAAL